MNVPANILPPQLTRYVDAVHTFLPGCDGRELELRCRIMSARDTASASLSRGLCSPEARATVAEMSRLASTYAYMPASEEQLDALLIALRALIKAAFHLDQFAEAAVGRG
jgi:hypothetical protein